MLQQERAGKEKKNNRKVHLVMTAFVTEIKPANLSPVKLFTSILRKQLCAQPSLRFDGTSTPNVSTQIKNKKKLSQFQSFFSAKKAI